MLTTLDLKNYQVTVREILTNPAAKAVIRRELPEVMNSPLLSFAQSMTLRQVLSLAGNIPQEKRDRILAALKEA